MDNATHVALVKGEVDGRENVLVRVHSECLTGDVFGSHSVSCGHSCSSAQDDMKKKGWDTLVL